MEKIANEVNLVLESLENEVEKNESFRDLLNASFYFDELVKQGIIKSRGNNLLTTSEFPIYRDMDIKSHKHDRQ